MEKGEQEGARRGGRRGKVANAALNEAKIGAIILMISRTTSLRLLFWECQANPLQE